MIPPQLRSFVFQLIDATNSGAVQWTPGEWPAFFCSHKDFTIHLASRPREYDETTLLLMRIESPDGSLAFFEVSQYEEDFVTMNALFDSVSVNASNMAQKLQNFFD